MAKRSAAMYSGSDMPAPGFAGLGHGALDRTASIISRATKHYAFRRSAAATGGGRYFFTGHGRYVFNRRLACRHV